jgi:hypothetical protein
MAAANIGEKLGEQVGIPWAVPQMVVGNDDDRQVGFENLLGEASPFGPALVPKKGKNWERDRLNNII